MTEIVTDRVHDLLDRAAGDRGDAIALVEYSGRQMSWSELAAASFEAAATLAEAGVKGGDRVVLVFENCAAVPAFFFACSRLNASAVVVNARLSEAELARTITHSDPSALVFTTDVSEAARAHADRLAAQPLEGAFGTVAILARDGATPEEVHRSAEAQVALMLYTSGTTGAPKAAMLTHRNLIAASEATADVRGINACDVCFLALPLSHVFGLVTLLAVTRTQGRMRLEARFQAERLYDALQEDVTFLPAVPQMHAHLFHYMRENGKPQYSRGLLRAVSSGGAPLDPAWKREAEAFYGLALQNGYGLTEASAGVCATRNDIGDPDISVGRPMGHCVFRLDMAATGANPEEQIGEILVAGPQVMKGYFRDPEQTARAFTDDGFFRTGDLGRYDALGRMHIVGRSKELIIRSGFNVYPVEIEATLTDHPEVIVAGVIGRAVAGNEEVLAFVKVGAESRVTEAELKAFAADRLAPYKRPSRIILAQDLPAAPTGKILKAKLIDTFADQLN
ncbi:class I adenylate-forming enzyme family protein [Phaeobacter sp. B1627]|uniref:class I adenylate-forming enzyme family protein n=1 Tax=Phaeobacter sp. B1627 TaxID=2583809 RepID=UPI001118E8E2|nr:class I adenylate-forming enzyme family protein [Phaeobacter sp. B1627]TNJ44427.1 acyl--CoA ligase [Phaeobacter sp. B1627]